MSGRRKGASESSVSQKSRRARSTLDGLHRFLGRASPTMFLAVKVRNQCNAIIGAGLNDGIDPRYNGELWLIEQLQGSVRRFVDVGANVGEWTELMLSREPGASGLCFEPAPSAYAALCKRADRWPTVTLSDSAVSDFEGEMELIDYGDCRQTSGQAMVVETSSEAVAAIKVPVTTLDAALDAAGWINVDCLKVDAEGLDWRVLRGARKLLERRGVRVVQFEYGPFWAASGGKIRSTVLWLESLGYCVYRLRSTGLTEPRLDFFGETFSYANFVALLSSEALARDAMRRR